MHRYLGLFLLLFGMVGGWWLGRPPASVVVDEVPAPQAWQHYLAETRAAQVCHGDVGPHPAWVALLLAFSTLTLLTAVSPNPRRAWTLAVGLPLRNPFAMHRTQRRNAAVIASTS